MRTFENILKEFGWKQSRNNTKYCQIGKIFSIKNEDFDGLYWFYETEDFIINIHDFLVKKEKMITSFPDISSYMAFSSSYINVARGESFDPYQTLTSNTMFVSNTDNRNFRFLLHANFPYLSVGVDFKDKMIEEYLTSHLNNVDGTISEMFFKTKELIIKPMEKLANAILNCKMDSPAAAIFLEAKAKEWLSITMNAYLSKSQAISESDEKAIENVTNYINDHFPLDISQNILEKIATISGTKLKTVFKQKHQMSITEYTQRKRMNFVETLLSTTDLEIKDIAKAVGYSSHSRFSTLFKKYKGIYPRDIKKQSTLNKI